MKRLLLLLLLCSSIAQAQIVNAESLRKVSDTSRWSGSATLNFALARNVNDLISLGTDIHLQYNKDRHLALFKNQILFQKLNDEDFSNGGIQHFRYNYRLTTRWTAEAFAQGQYNRVAKIGFRGLIGTGPRFAISTNEKYRVNIGSLLMYEYEKVDDGITPLQRDFRLSSYLALSFYPTDNITFVSTTYYQPQVDQWSDHRVSSESNLVFMLYKNLKFNMTYVFIFDAFPAVGIPTSQYRLSSGLTYTFD